MINENFHVGDNRIPNVIFSPLKIIKALAPRQRYTSIKCDQHVSVEGDTLKQSRMFHLLPLRLSLTNFFCFPFYAELKSTQWIIKSKDCPDGAAKSKRDEGH